VAQSGIFFEKNIIKRLGNATTFCKQKSFKGDLFILPVWKNGMLECWNIGSKNGY